MDHFKWKPRLDESLMKTQTWIFYFGVSAVSSVIGCGWLGIDRADISERTLVA